MKKVNPIIQWWVTPKLPSEHIFIPSKDRPKRLDLLVGVYVKKWLVHPLKRRIAKYYLFLLQKMSDLTVIGITGSAGKTTTKEMLASILQQSGKTVASYENIDPVYNIPTTILKCRPQTKYLVLEMGVEYPGEMDYYLWLVRPDVAVITNIYPTHTQFFGDSGGVYREKSKLAINLSADKTVVLNKKDKQLRKLEDVVKANIIWYGDGAQVMSSLEKITKSRKTQFLLIMNKNSKERIRACIPMVGKHFVNNALAAAGVAYHLGVSLEIIKQGLKNFSVPEHRMKIIKRKNGTTILDDSYNNNPQAAKYAIDTLLAISGRANKVIVFGDMLELGNWERKYHIKLGEYISKAFPNKLICVGIASQVTAKVVAKKIGKHRVFHYNNWKEALSETKRSLKGNTYLLVKGSRSIGLEKLVGRLS